VSAAAQQTPKVTLETSETLFSVMAALNACGYNQELSASNPVRAKVRAELARAAESSPEATGARDQVCQFYRDHRQPDPGLDVAQYVSLALNLEVALGVTPRSKELRVANAVPTPQAVRMMKSRRFIGLVARPAACHHDRSLRNPSPAAPSQKASNSNIKLSQSSQRLETNYVLPAPQVSATLSSFSGLIATNNID